MNIDYDNHAHEWERILTDKHRQKHSETWMNKNTLDYWRHDRMRKVIKPFINDDPSATWLTVGDGRYGTDANYLLSSGAKTVHCSDISDTLLKIGKKVGYINEYSCQNAENLTFADREFDYVYCKEALHHCPRPYIALNEMFRVARKAVILTEPRDQMIDAPAGFFIFKTIAKIFAKETYRYSFEDVGNYVYPFSEREAEKFLLGMHYRYLAVVGCNDAYIPGVEFVPLTGFALKWFLLRFRIKSIIFLKDFLCSLRIIKSGVITTALFREQPSLELSSDLNKIGWCVKLLPDNPFKILKRET